MSTVRHWRPESGHRARSRGHAGLTLVELLVVLVLLALVAGVAAPALVRLPEPATWRTRADAALAHARRDALAQGTPVTVVVVTPDGPARATALPDGGILADPMLGVERLTGRRIAARSLDTGMAARTPTPREVTDADQH